MSALLTKRPRIVRRRNMSRRANAVIHIFSQLFQLCTGYAEEQFLRQRLTSEHFVELLQPQVIRIDRPIEAIVPLFHGYRSQSRHETFSQSAVASIVTDVEILQEEARCQTRAQDR
jgi:hypothetical protein